MRQQLTQANPVGKGQLKSSSPQVAYVVNCPTNYDSVINAWLQISHANCKFLIMTRYLKPHETSRILYGENGYSAEYGSLKSVKIRGLVWPYIPGTLRWYWSVGGE